MKKQLPTNLNLLTIKLPIPGLVSILHRISGFILFLLIPLLLWVLQQSLISPVKFQVLHDLFTNPLLKLLLWGSLSALIYHLFAGIRHLSMDMHILPENWCAGKLSGWVVLGLSAMTILFLGWMIWL